MGLEAGCVPGTAARTAGDVVQARVRSQVAAGVSHRAVQVLMAARELGDTRDEVVTLQP